MIAELAESLQNIFGYSNFRPGQEEIISHILSRKHLLAVMPTGAGKSLCYQLPAVLFNGRTIIVSPLIALMNDQVSYLKSIKVPAESIHSHQSYAENVTSWLAFVRGDIKILYISPERLMTEKLLSALTKISIDLFVIDEAHCVSKWGAGFRPQYDRLRNIQSIFPNSTLAAFTATADKTTRTDISEKLTSGNARIIVKGFDRPNLSLTVALKNGWKVKVLNFLKERAGLSGIIYTLSRRETENVAKFLNDNGYNAIAYHAGLDSEVRKIAQETFMSKPGIIMVATIAFGMGIDKADIRFVVHVNLPMSIEALYQEIGRAGRDGKLADTVLIYGMNDVIIRRRMIQESDGSNEHKLRENKRLDALMAYCEASGCRKKILLAYFGQLIENCNNCDNCVTPPELMDGTEEAQLVLQTIISTGEYFGAVHIVNILRGTSTEKIRHRNHDRLKSYGRGAELPNNFWHSLIRQLIAAVKITIDLERFGALRITAEGARIIGGEEKFQYKKNMSQKVTSKVIKTGITSSIKTDSETSLLVKLKELRLEMARKIKSPAYVIFSDQTLGDMVEKKPRTRIQMLKVNGVGEKKFERYGDQFLALINQYSS